MPSYDIYLKINLALPPGFKVINVKNFIRKILNVNLISFNSLTSVITEFPTSNFIFDINPIFAKKVEPHVSLFFLFASLFGKM